MAVSLSTKNSVETRKLLVVGAFLTGLDGVDLFFAGLLERHRGGSEITSKKQTLGTCS